MHFRFITCTAVVAAFFCISLGLFVFLKDTKKSANRYFLLWQVALAIWNLNELAVVIPRHEIALILFRISYIPASFIGYGFLMFMWEIIEYKSDRVSRFVSYTAALFAFLSPTTMLVQDIHIDITNSTPINEIHGPLYIGFALFYLGTMLYSLLPILTRYKIASAAKRNQFRFIIVAISSAVLGLVNFFANQINDNFPPLYYLLEMFISVIFAGAILLYRLMDISVIIRKTLIYSVVTGSLVALYLVLVAISTRFFQGVAGFQTVFSSGVAAALITFFFQPLRKRVQQFVDAKFFRQYVDREEKLYELSRDVITHTTPEAMAQALMHVLQETLHPKIGSLYLRSRDGDGFIPMASWGGQGNIIPEDNALVQYFADHPQPFVQDIFNSPGQSRDTRDVSHKDRLPS